MALTQDQVNYWFTQNPNATADDVAAAVKGAGGLDANAGLADMIANRYNVGSNQVTDYYNQYTGGLPSQPTGAPVSNITTDYVKPSNAPTSGGVSNVVEGDDIFTQIKQLPQEISHWARSADQRYMELIDDKTGAVLDRRAVGDFSDVDMVKMGLSMVPGAGQVLGAVSALDAARKGDLVGAAIGATGLVPGMSNVNTALRVGQAVDSGNTLGALTALAGNTDVQNFVGANNVNIGGYTANDAVKVANLTTAAQNGQWGQVIANAGELAKSSDTTLAGKALAVLQAAQSGNSINALNMAVSAFGGTPTTSTKTSSLSDVGVNAYAQAKAAGATDDEALAAANLATGETTLPSGVQLASTGDTIFKTDIGGAPIFAESKGAGSVRVPFGYSLLSSSEADDKPEGSYYDPTTNAWFKPDTEVTSLGGSSDIQSDIDLFKSSQGDLDTIAASTTGTSDDQVADFLKSIGITNTTQLADSGLSNQDILDQINASKTTGDNVDELVITGDKNKTTDTTIDTVTGGGGNDDIQELVITGDKNKTTDTDIDTITGGGGDDIVDDKGTVVITDKKDTCPIGTKLNPETGECDPISEVEDKGTVTVVDKKDTCPIGTRLNSETGNCDPIEDQPLTCPTGFHLSADGKSCEPDEEKPLTCPTGFHLSADGKSCEPDVIKKNLECPEGFELNDEGTACIPVIVIKDNKCAEGYVYDEELKQCVPIKKKDECGVGYHWDEATQSCVKDAEKTECAAGYHWDEATQSCVKDTVVTPPVVTPKTTTKAPTFAAGPAAVGGSGKKTEFLKEQLLKTYMTKDSFKDPLAQFNKARQDMAKEEMMQQGVDPRLAAILAAKAVGEEAPPKQTYNYGEEPSSIDDILSLRTEGEQNYAQGGYVQPLMAQGGMALPLLAAKGGLPAMHKGREDFRDGKHVAGEGDGQSDDIPAMLADGEFVFPADVVSALGNGSTKAGTDKLYEMMHSIRDRARSKGPKDLPPPALKSPLDYLKKR